MSDVPEIKIKSLKKAIDVLNCFIDKQPIGITEISEKLGFYKSNVHSILTTLAALDYVDQDKETGKYYLGIGALRLGHAIGDRYSFKNVAKKHITLIADETGEQVYFTVPFDGHTYFLDTAYPDSGAPVLLGNIKNPLEMLHTTGSGKAMMAYMSHDYLEEYLSKPLARTTEYSITDASKLIKELESIKKQGYATDRQEALIGISCVAVPILSVGGDVMGAISISGPSPRFSEEKIAEFAQILKKHAKEIQQNI